MGWNPLKCDRITSSDLALQHQSLHTLSSPWPSGRRKALPEELGAASPGEVGRTLSQRRCPQGHSGCGAQRLSGAAVPQWSGKQGSKNRGTLFIPQHMNYAMVIIVIWVQKEIQKPWQSGNVLACVYTRWVLIFTFHNRFMLQKCQDKGGTDLKMLWHRDVNQEEVGKVS